MLRVRQARRDRGGGMNGIAVVLIVCGVVALSWAFSCLSREARNRRTEREVRRMNAERILRSGRERQL